MCLGLIQGLLKDPSQGVSRAVVSFASDAHSRAVGRIQFLVGCWPEGFSSPLDVGQRPPSVLCPVNLSISSSLHGNRFPSEQAKKREQERTKKTEATVLL